MESVETQLCAELTHLRRGRGLNDPKVHTRIGPGLRQALGIAVTDPAVEQRDQLRAGLNAAARSLPPDLGLAMFEALAIDRLSPPTLTAREERLTEALKTGPRTVRRRISEATVLVARNLAPRMARAQASEQFVKPGWEVEELAGVLRLSPDGARMTEDRLIVATQNLTHVTSNLSMPPGPGGEGVADRLTLVAEEGCEISGVTQVSDVHWVYDLALPRPLQAGERHRYRITFLASSLAVMQPYYVLVPFRTYQRFSAEVHFGTPAVADAAWRVDGVPPALLRAAGGSSPVPIDPAATPVVRVEHRNTTPGLCYGVRWSWASGMVPTPPAP